MQNIIKNKIHRTTFGVVSSHIISTVFLFPLLWLIAGSLAKGLLTLYYPILEPYLSTVYYLIMLGSFYLGIKYSLYYINKNVSVALPEKSGRQSILFFSALVIISNYTLFYFENSINIQRLIFSLILLYMFAVMTKRYFHTLEKSSYIECIFFLQIIILISNLSILISLFLTYGVLHESSVTLKLIVTSAFIPLLLILTQFDVVDKVFIPFEYEVGKQKPIKKALLTIAVSIPINILLLLYIIKYHVF